MHIFSAKRSILTISFSFFMLVASFPCCAAQEVNLSPLIIQTAQGRSHHFQVEIATTDQERAHGLMYRKTLPKNQGMIFIYDTPDILEMWMKNTYIPLDMIFINEQGIITNIAQNTRPHSREVIASNTPAIAVLEVNAGTTQELTIQHGDKVLHSALP